MKFEIDPNELTTDQRAHVAAFITGWPTSYGSHNAKIRRFTSVLSEEQRLDAEQKTDMDTTGELREISGAEEAYAIGAAQADNLNAIFGTPTATEHTKVDSLVPLDKEGLPWDSRIHSSSKATIADGSWKLRRGVDPAEVENVKVQLKELMAVPAFYSQGVVSPDKVPFAPVLSESGAETPVVTIGSASTVPVPPAPKSHYLIDQAPVTLTDLIGRMSAAIAAGKLTQANVTEICVKHGVSEFFLLGNRPDLFPLIDADMKAMGV